jgi:hypothetical protein
MAGRDAGGFGSIHQFVLDDVMGYFRVVLHPRLPQDVCPIATDCLRPQALLLGADPLPVNLSDSTEVSRFKVVHSSITETESMEKLRPDVFWMNGRKARHQFQINREN